MEETSVMDSMTGQAELPETIDIVRGVRLFVVRAEHLHWGSHRVQAVIFPTFGIVQFSS